jgi:protein OS-9
MAPGKAYEIEEDPDWEAYDLGRAPEPGSGADVGMADHGALAANLELARGAGSRYLVQRWGDGTKCDKTGKRREIEVQFHCSMTMTDSIMFVKETKTCHYILVVNTPRLCGEPGFKSRIDQRDAALIRCRQVVDAATLANADSSLPEADHPFSQRRPPVANHPPLDAAEALSSAGVETGGGDASHTATEPDAKHAYDHNDMLRRALEAILQKTGNPQGNDADADTTPRVVVEDIGDGEMVIEFISEIEMNDEGGGDAQQRVDDISQLMDSKVFEDALRAAGFDVRDEEVEVEVRSGRTRRARKADRKRIDGRRMALPRVAGERMRMLSSCSCSLRRVQTMARP